MKTHHALLALSTLAATLLSATSAHAALTAVTLGGVAGAGVYDSTANVTWLANANLMATNTFGLSHGVNYGNDAYGNPSEIYSGGSATWSGAEMWIAAMNAADYLGYNTWELPTTAVPDAGCGSIATGYGCTSSMMGNLFYTELGGTAGDPITTTHTNTAGYNLFNNVQASIYWSGTAYAPNPASAWYFITNKGSQDHTTKSTNLYAWAVLPGDVGMSAVPVPAAVWLFSSGLLGLLGMSGKRRR
jgi:hypothetical protein